MSILADTGYVYALYNPEDAHHKQAVAFSNDNTDPILLPAVILPELGFLFRRDLGYAGIVQFLNRFKDMDASIEAMVDADLWRISEIAAQYADARFDIVDCCIMAMADRLNIAKVATFDRRDFRIFKPRHTDYFELLP